MEEEEEALRREEEEARRREEEEARRREEEARRRAEEEARRLAEEQARRLAEEQARRAEQARREQDARIAEELRRVEEGVQASGQINLNPTLIGQDEQQDPSVNDALMGGLGLGGAAFAAQTGRAPTPSPTGTLSPFAQQVAANDAARLASQNRPALIGTGTQTSPVTAPRLTPGTQVPATTGSTTLSTTNPPSGASNFNYRVNASPRLLSRFGGPGALAYGAADIGTQLATGRGLSERIGDFAGSTIGDALFPAATGLPAFSPEELASSQQLTSPQDRPQNPIEAAFTLGSGTDDERIIAVRSDGQREQITADQLADFSNTLRQAGQAQVTGLGRGGDAGVNIVNPQGLTPPPQQAPASVSPIVADQPQATGTTAPTNEQVQAGLRRRGGQLTKEQSDFLSNAVPSVSPEVPEVPVTTTATTSPTVAQAPQVSPEQAAFDAASEARQTRLSRSPDFDQTFDRSPDTEGAEGMSFSDAKRDAKAQLILRGFRDPTPSQVNTVAREIQANAVEEQSRRKLERDILELRLKEANAKAARAGRKPVGKPYVDSNTRLVLQNYDDGTTERVATAPSVSPAISDVAGAFNAGQTTPSVPITINTQADYDKLPVGTEYTDSQGNFGIKR